MNRNVCIFIPPANPYTSLDLPEFGSYTQALSTYLDTQGPWNTVVAIILPANPGTTKKPTPTADDQQNAFIQDFKYKCQHSLNFKEIRPVEPVWELVLQDLLPVFTSDEGELWWIWADTPFLNPVLSKRLSDLFTEYIADFAFADGYPRGLTPEIVFLPRLGSLYQLAKIHRLPIDRGGVFELIQKDINSFHIETLMSEGDYRTTRLELFGEFRRTHLLVKQLAPKVFPFQNPSEFEDLQYEQIFNEAKTPQRSIPAFIQLQISAPCPHSCSYCPYPLINPNHLSDMRFMNLEKIKLFIQKIKEFMPEGTINVSFLGEPGLHPEILSILRYLNDNTPYQILLETTGVGWNPEVVQNLIDQPLDNLRIIIGLDTNDPDRYTQLGKIGFQEAQRFTDQILQGLGDKVFVQTLRLKGGEEDLLSFYKYWEKKTQNIIIQKYDGFTGLLPDKRVVDLQPMNRFPCWHIKRSLAVLLDGRVVRCKEDIQGNQILGNIFENPIEDIWNALEPLYHNHRQGVYPSPCDACDEYYTYGF